jgi:hypothetical protein
MNANATIQIHDLRLRVPGLSREQARQLGETVARRLADVHLSGTSASSISALSLRVPVGAPVSVDRLAHNIVAGIRRSLT